MDGANEGTDVFGTWTALARFFKSGRKCIFGNDVSYFGRIHGNGHCRSSGINAGIVAAVVKAGTSVTVPEEQWISSGFFGALIAGFLAGVLMLLQKTTGKLPRALKEQNRFFYIRFLEYYHGGDHDLCCNPPVGHLIPG